MCIRDSVSRRVQIRGTGLIGTSLGIALTRKGYAVSLADPSPTAERLARDLGAGQLAHCLLYTSRCV